MKPELLASCRAQCGELPQWDGPREQLIWTDIPGNKLFRWHEQTGKWEQFYSGKLVGGIVLQEDDSLLLFGENEIFRLRDDGSEEVLVRNFDPSTGRVNETIADPEGRVFFGTVCPEWKSRGGLYRLDADGRVTKIADGTGCANGMGFTPDNRGFYWTDSTGQTVWMFDYNQQNGALKNQRAWLQIPKEKGTPDGMTVDVEGCVWVAFFGGSCARRYSPDGELLQTLEMPVENVTSVTFGGRAMRDLFLTSAGGDGNSDEPDGSLPGGLFRVRDAGQGLPEFRAHVLLGER